MRYARWAAWALVGALLLVLLLFPGQVSRAQVSVLNYFASPGSGRNNELVLDGTVTRSGVLLTATTTGIRTLDGANPTSITLTFDTGVLYCLVSQVGHLAPGDDPVYLTYVATVGGLTLDVHAWKYESGTDPTLIGSTNSTAQFTYSCSGN